MHNYHILFPCHWMWAETFCWCCMYVSQLSASRVMTLMLIVARFLKALCRQHVHTWRLILRGCVCATPAHWVWHSETDLLDIMFNTSHSPSCIFSPFFSPIPSLFSSSLFPHFLCFTAPLLFNLLLRSLFTSHPRAAWPSDNRCRASLGDHAGVCGNISRSSRNR